MVSKKRGGEKVVVEEDSDVDMEVDDGGEDKVVHEVPLYLNELVDPYVSLLQFPLKPAYFDLAPGITDAKIRKLHKKLEFSIPHDKLIYAPVDDGDDEYGPAANRAATAAEPGRGQSQSLKMHSTEVPKKTNHGLIFYDEDRSRFNITPVDYVLQMRPCIGDMLSQQRRYERDWLDNGEDNEIFDEDYVAAESKDGEKKEEEEEEETAAAPQLELFPVHHRKESERGYQKRVQRFAHRQQVEMSENRESLRVSTLASGAADAQAMANIVAGRGGVE